MRRAGIVGAFAVIASSTALGTVASAQSAAQVSLTGKILFTRAGGQFGDETVYTARANGTHQRRITGYGKTCCPGWSPDGRHIFSGAMAPDGRITTGIRTPDGRLQRRIPLPRGTLNLGCSQAYSPRTGRFACEGWSDKRAEMQGLYTIALNGKKLVRVTHCSTLQDDRPFGYSLDSSTIFFFRADTAFPSIGDQLEGSLFAVRTDGTHLRRLTSTKTPVEVVGNAGGRLSPDGRKIVFTSAGAIWTVGADGSTPTKVFADRGGRLAITPT